jgi:hypothetical protein
MRFTSHLVPHFAITVLRLEVEEDEVSNVTDVVSLVPEALGVPLHVGLSSGKFGAPLGVSRVSC